MPIYEYVCENCHNELEALQKISEPHLTECPSCGQSTLKRKTSVSAFHLKGGGWYKDGYSVPSQSDKPVNGTAKPASETSTTETKPTSKTESTPPKAADSKKSTTDSVPSSKAS